MLAWSALLFFIGVMAFLDSMFNMGEIFRRVNSVLFLLISLGLLIRTTRKMRESKAERDKAKIFQLEQRIRVLEQGREKISDF